jgi:hypothetical protein
LAFAWADDAELFVDEARNEMMDGSWSLEASETGHWGTSARVIGIRARKLLQTVKL